MQCQAESSHEGTASTVCEVSHSAPDGGEEVAMLDEAVLCGRLKNSVTLEKLDSLLDHFPSEKAIQLAKLIRDYPCMFGDTPSRTNLIQHDIDVGDAKSEIFPCLRRKTEGH